MGKKRTHDEFIELINNLYDNEYEVLEKYINKETPILIKHKICGQTMLRRPGHMLRGHGCKTCTCKKVGEKKRNEYAKVIAHKINSINHGEFVLQSEYNGRSNYVKIKHKICGQTHEYIPEYFLQDSRCCCQKKVKMYTTESYKRHLSDKYPEYTIESEYINSDTRVIYLHIACGNKFCQTPSRFKLTEIQCPYCRNEFNRKQYEQKTETVLPDDYKILTNNYKSHDKILIQHSVCKCLFVAKAYVIKDRRNRSTLLCPQCRIHNLDMTKNKSFRIDATFSLKHHIDSDYYWVKINDEDIIMHIDDIKHYMHAINQEGA